MEASAPATANIHAATAAVAITNLDAAVAQSKTAAALLLTTAAEIRKLPAVDVVTERHGDGAPAQAHHAAVSADIREQVNGPVREALADLDAACHRWVPVQRGAITISVSISGGVNKDTVRAIGEQVRRSLTAHTFGARLATATLGAGLAGLPVAVDHAEADALREYLGSQPVGVWMSNASDELPLTYRGPALNLAGHVIDVFNSADLCTWNGARFVVTDA